MKKSASSKPTQSSSLNQVTTLSKVFAAILFVSLPFLGFWLGFTYQNEINEMYAACMSVTQNLSQ